MARLFGLTGKAAGKYGNAVFRIRYGQQVLSQYNPIVANPKTPLQVENRAKLKLISQLSAVMAPVIAMPREGVRTPRNLFTQYNYGSISYVDSSDPAQASVQLSNIKLTRSVVSLSPLEYIPGQEGSGQVTVRTAYVVSNVDRIIYSLFTVMPDNTLRFVESKISTTEPTFTVDFTVAPQRKNVVYAYGVRVNSERAQTVFDNMEVASGTAIAKLLASRSLTENDITLTETQFIDLGQA